MGPAGAGQDRSHGPRRPGRRPGHGSVRALRADATANAVWDGRQVYVFGGRGEYVSFQLCVENVDRGPIPSIQVSPQPLAGPDGAKIGPENVELYWNWYARNGQGQWQPAYCVPMEPGTPLVLPRSESPDRADGRLAEQRNQTIYVDLYVPKDAKPGTYAGAMTVSAGRGPQIEVPVVLNVLGFTLPDRLSFWPELDAFRIPADAVDYYRLAHQHRCVLNCMSWRPKVTGEGADAKVQWEQYDRRVGPLLTGEAFAANRRAGVPVECMYLPFDESWPTPLSPETYRYSGPWAKQGDGIEGLAAHSLAAPYIGEGLSRGYQDAFAAVQRQFIEHFQEKGYRRTEMQCCFVAKATNRIDFGSNSWWTTDEPYYWDDWLAVQFFLQSWARGRAGTDPRIWTARADVPGRNGRGERSTAWPTRSIMGRAGSTRRPWSAAAGPWGRRPGWTSGSTARPAWTTAATWRTSARCWLVGRMAPMPSPVGRPWAATRPWTPTTPAPRGARPCWSPATASTSRWSPTCGSRPFATASS